MIVVYGLTVAVAVGWLIHACILTKEVLTLRATLDSRPLIDHDQCIDRVSRYISQEFAAMILQDAARQWDTVDERKNIERLRNHWTSDQPGVVNQWLNEKAEQWRARGNG